MLTADSCLATKLVPLIRQTQISSPAPPTAQTHIWQFEKPSRTVQVKESVVNLATTVFATRDFVRSLRWMYTMIDESAPLSAFRDSSAPGARLRTIGSLLLIFSALYGYYLFRERAIERLDADQRSCDLGSPN